MEEVIRELIDYIKAVRRSIPNIKIGLLEAAFVYTFGEYPGIGKVSGDLREILDDPDFNSACFETKEESSSQCLRTDDLRKILRDPDPICSRTGEENFDRCLKMAQDDFDSAYSDIEEEERDEREGNEEGEGGEEEGDFSQYLKTSDLQEMLDDPDLLEGSSKATMSVLIDIKRTIERMIEKGDLWQTKDINKLKKNFNTKLLVAKKRKLFVTVKKFKI